MAGWEAAYNNAFRAGWEAASEYGFESGFEEGQEKAREERAIEHTLAEDDIYREGYADGLRDHETVIKKLHARITALEREVKPRGQ
jgi:flagellar biosynthesis/type III secretory pathway protein FliH